jgi:protoporphyrinogen/coproporphyrinogen III oxidase
MTESERPSVLVVGAGISGLTAAHALLRERPDIDLCVVEQQDRVGGNIWTIREQGYLIEAGPDSFLRTKTEAAALCREVGLGDELISPNPAGRRVLIAHRGQLVPMPAGMALAVPTRLGPMVSTPLLSWSGKFRVLGDLAVPKPTGDPRDETVASFLVRHFGHEATENIAGPLLSGIFAGDIEELSILSTFPQLVELERRHGSLIRAFFAAERARAAKNQTSQRFGAAVDDPLYLPDWLDLLRWLRRQAHQAESPFQSLRGGMGQLVDALRARVPDACVRLGIALLKLEQMANNKWRAHLSNETRLDVDSVILCMPAHAATAVLGDEGLRAELKAISNVATAAVYLALDQACLPRPLDASGYMVPRGEGWAFASTWASSKWEGRAPNGGALVRVSLGGARNPALAVNSTEAALGELARQELERMIGIVGTPLLVRVFKHVRPQPTVGHIARLARIEGHVANLPGLLFASSVFGGTGIPDCIRRAECAARLVLDYTRRRT